MLIRAFFERRTTNQSPEDWRKEVAAKIQPPSLTIRSYGGGEINVIGQLSVIMSVGERKCQQTVLVQKGASVDLLLGTDTLPCLGFHLLLRPHEDKPTIDMMTSKEMETAVGKQDTGCLEVPPTVVPKQNSNPSGDMNLERTLNLTLGDTDDNLNTHCKDKIEVKLLTATRLPGRQAKVLRAQVSNTLGVKDVVFEPYEFLSDDQKLVMTEALIEPNKEGYVKLLIENHESHPVFLEAGTMLGQLQAVQIINNDKVPEVLHLREEDLNLVEETMPEPPSTPTERSQQLLDRINVAWNAISAEEGYKLKSLIDEYNDVFAIDPMEVGRTDLVQHRIDTGGQTPLRQPPRRIPFSLRAKVEKMVQEMLDTGIIEHSSSPWASPIVLVSKQDGSTRFCVDYRRLNAITKLDEFPLPRFCVDYRRLNAITKLDEFPLPRVDDSLDLLAGMKYFTTLDLASGYWLVGMAPEAQEKTAFVTHEGLYEFSVMPFGLCNAPATFQRLMEITLRGLARLKCVVYLDDIMVIGRSFEDHLDNLREVLERLRQAGLKLKPKKCHLVQSEVTYLGYVVSESGISVDASKVKAVRDFPVPKNLKQLRSFLGLASYYRRSMSRFSQVAAPLFVLTRKDTPYQ